MLDKSEITKQTPEKIAGRAEEALGRTQRARRDYIWHRGGGHKSSTAPSISAVRKGHSGAGRGD